MNTDEVFRLWNDYDWNWKTTGDVQKFVDDAVESGCYEYSLGAFGVFTDGVEAEDWYFNYWNPVHEAIADIAKNFSESEMEAALDILMKPFADYSDGDPAIYDALLESLPGFPVKWDKYADTLNEYTRNWSEFAWYCPIGRAFTWTYFSAETVAKCHWIPAAFLREMFEETAVGGFFDHPNRLLRIRLALATNPNTPTEILNFIFENRHNADWLIYDPEESGALVLEDGRYRINEDVEGFKELRAEAETTRKFQAATGDMWYDCGQPQYIDHLAGIDWEATDATEALLMCLAKNPALPEEFYDQLAAEDSAPVTYILSKNLGIPDTMKARFALENPTLTFQPVMSTYADEETLR